MSARLIFPEPATARDVLTFAHRSARLGDGTLRLQARDGLLVATCAPVAPRSLADPTPLVLGMRTARVDPELECDLVIDGAALVPDRDAGALRLPETATTATWVGVSPPRAGWRAEGDLAAAEIAARAQWGIAAVAEALPPGAGDEVVHRIRSEVWGRSDDALAGLPLGVAFAAFGLGFIAGEERPVIRRTDAWARVTFARGHVLSRGPVALGLTPVRATGRSA